MFSFCTYLIEDVERVGLVVDGSVVEAGGALMFGRGDGGHETPVASMLDLLERWDTLLPRFREVADRLRATSPHIAAVAGTPSAEAPDSAMKSAGLMSIDDAVLTAPVPRPGKMINVGLNFVDHAREMGIDLPESGFRPSFFFKGGRQCIVGPGHDIELSSHRVDWEGELALVIGRRCRNVSTADALDHVAGYTCHNDVTDRGLMMRPDGSLDFLAGKARDTFGPLGPVLVPREFVPDVRALRVKVAVGGEVMQDFGCAGLVWGPAECVAYLSTVMTLEPGDVVALGTGSGVGWAYGLPAGPRTFADVLAHFHAGGGRYLQSGDRVTVEIEGVGRLENGVA